MLAGWTSGSAAKHAKGGPCAQLQVRRFRQQAVQRRDWATSRQAEWPLIGQRWPAWPPSRLPAATLWW